MAPIPLLETLRQRPAPAATDPAAAARPPARRPRLYVLDALRLIAALAVVSWHYAGMERFPEIWGKKAGVIMPKLHWVANYGWAGVELFFLISGFVICMSTWGRPIGHFVTSRVVRLFPAYWFSVLGMAALIFITRTPWNADALKGSYSNVIINLTMMQEGVGGFDLDGVYWTLWVELRFYLLFGMLAVGGLTYRKVVAFCGGWLVMTVVTTSTNLSLLNWLFFPRYAPYFIAGIALYMIYRFGSSLMLWGIVGFSWMMAQHHLRWIVNDYYWQKISYNVSFALVTLSFLLMVGVALGWFDWIQWKSLGIAGALTYPLYLIHEQLGWYAIYRLHDDLNAYVLVGLIVLAVLVLSWLIHRLVERPAAAVLQRSMKASMVDLRNLGGRERKPRHSA